VHKVCDSRHADLDLSLPAPQILGIGVLDVDGKGSMERGFKVPGQLEDAIHTLLDERRAPRGYGAGEIGQDGLDVLLARFLGLEVLAFEQQRLEEFVGRFSQSAHEIVDSRVPEDADGNNAIGGLVSHCAACL